MFLITMLFFLGIRVLLGVDATNLESHPIIGLEYFDFVVFNFPHVGGKMRIEKNRELIKNFFISVKNIIHKNSKIFMTLCNGQGGTSFDSIKRHWNDSWQVTEMAAHGNFLLTAIESYEDSLFETYKVTGYRSLEKKFNTYGCLTHIFELFEKPSINNIVPEEKLNFCEYYSDSISWKDLLQKFNKLNYNSFALYFQIFKFDISFRINNDFNIIQFYETLYNNAGLIIENVELINSYTFPNSKEISKTFRINYKSDMLPIHKKLAVYFHENVIPDIIENNLTILVSR